MAAGRPLKKGFPRCRDGQAFAVVDANSHQEQWGAEALTEMEVRLAVLADGPIDGLRSARPRACMLETGRRRHGAKG
jgi:hypothetical protein